MQYVLEIETSLVVSSSLFLLCPHRDSLSFRAGHLTSKMQREMRPPSTFSVPSCPLCNSLAEFSRAPSVPRNRYRAKQLSRFVELENASQYVCSSSRLSTIIAVNFRLSVTSSDLSSDVHLDLRVCLTISSAQ